MKILGPDNTTFDFSVGEDANAITIADTNLQLDSFTRKHRVTAAEQGQAFLISLPEDGGVNGRFRFGELNEVEERNWVARATRFISIPTGQFAIDAGGFFGQEVEADVTEAVDFVTARVPAGDYQLTCHVYLCSDIATDLFKNRNLSYLQWYRNTHPQVPFPEWLVELAECRDNDDEDEQLEELSQSDVDDESENDFLGLLLQLQPIQDGHSITETKFSKNGKLSWEKRLPSEFPDPIVLSEASERQGTYAMTKLVAKAFTNKDFAHASTVFADSIQSDVIEFLAKHHADITAKMPIPTRAIRNTSLANAADWHDKLRKPKTLGDLKQLKNQEFAGTQYVSLDNSQRYQEIFVSFQLGFVKTETGFRAFAMELNWKTPRAQKRRRNQPADDAPPCPECGEKLMTSNAKQCLHCDATWH